MSKKTEELSKPRWFSENPDKAWAEKFFLVYSPIWIAQMAVAVVLGLSKKLGDAGYLVQAGLVALPLFIVPLVIYPRKPAGLRWHQTYWFKADVFITILSVIGSYFGTEYFFDVLGMVYNYPNIRLTFDSALLGSGRQTVPVIMYLLTVAYFMTYHTTAVILLRRVRTSGLRGMALLFPVAVFVVAYGWAWMETFAMANPMMQEVFYYRDMQRMMAFGSIVYACEFVVSFPIFYFLDETPAKRWSPLQTIGAALSAGMLTLFVLDLLTKIIGHI